MPFSSIVLADGAEEIEDVKGVPKVLLIYEAPFDQCDRENDYEMAWAEFDRHFKSCDLKQKIGNVCLNR